MVDPVPVLACQALTRRVSGSEKNAARLPNQHRLPARFNENLAEVADYGRLVQTQKSRQISGALGVLTVLGIL